MSRRPRRELDVEEIHAMTFEYRARDGNGASLTGVIEAASRQEALGLLAGRGLFPSSLDERGGARGSAPARTKLGVAGAEASRADKTSSASGSLSASAASSGSSGAGGARAASSSRASADAARPSRPPLEPPPSGARRHGRIRRKEVTAFTRELATLLEAGIAIPRALEGLAEEEESENLAALLREVAGDIRSGRSLSESLESYPRLFPRLYTSMVEVGEESGQLPRVLDDLASLLEDEDEIRSEVLGAIAYPAFVLIMGAVTTFVLLAFVLPRLFGMLEDLTDALPLPTRVLLATSRFLETGWLPLLALAVVLALGLRSYARSPGGALRIDRMKLGVPILGGVFRASVLARFSRTLGTLVHSGVSLLPALEIVRNTVGNAYVGDLIAQVAEETRGGDSLAAPVRRLGLFPPTMVQMVAVGEETGELATMLLRVAGIQEKLVRGRAKTLVSLLAPALILVVGALVGFIVIALLLPIFRMSQSLA